MEKLKKLLPSKIPTVGNQVIVPESQFNELISVINAQTKVINELIDATISQDSKITNVEKHTFELQTAIQHLAKALKIYSED